MALVQIETPKGLLEIEHDGDPAELTGAVDEWVKSQTAPDRSFLGALQQGLDAPLEAIGTTAEVFGMPRAGKAIKGLTEAPVNYESAAQRVVNPQEGDVTVAGFGAGSIPRAITEQLGQVAGTIISRAVGALAGRVIGGAIGGTAGSGTGPGALLTGATGQAVGSKVGSFVAPFAFQAMQIAGPTALERAKNNGRTEPNREDLAYALTTAAASGSLDAIGAKFLPGGEKAVGGWVKKISKAMGGELATETPQSVVEQAGGTLGTKTGLKIDPKQAIAEGLIGAGAGGAAAGVAIGAGSAVDAIKPKVKATVDQVDATIAEVATAEPPPVVLDVEIRPGTFRTEDPSNIPEDALGKTSITTGGKTVYEYRPRDREKLDVLEAQISNLEQQVAEDTERAADNFGDKDDLQKARERKLFQLKKERENINPIAAKVIPTEGEPNDATQEGEIPESSQPEREGIDAQRQAAEAGRSDSPEENGQVAQPVENRIRQAYEAAVKGNQGFSDVTIAELQKRSGLSLAELHEWIGKNAPNITLSRGDQVYGSEEAKAAALPNTSDPANPWQRIKLEDHFRQGKPDTPDDTSATGQIPPTAQLPSTEGQETDQAPEAAPLETGTATASAAQLEDQIGKLLDRHQAEKDLAVQSRLWEQAKGLVDQLEKVEGKSLGPGAASAAEKLATYALRKFGIRLQDDPRVAAEIKEAAGNRYYEVLPNKVTAAEATDLIDRVGEDQAERLIRDDKSDTSFAARSTVGQILIQRLNQQYQQLKTNSPQEAEAVLNRAADLAEWQMDFGTRLGQGVQSFAMWMRLTPEGKLMGIKKAVRKARERHTQQHEKEVNEVLSVLGTDRTQQEKTTDMQRLGKKNRTARRVRKKLKQLTEKPQTAQSFYDIASKELGLPELTAEQETELRDLAAKVDAAPEGLPKWKAAQAFLRYSNNIKGFTPTDFALGYFYGNILSGLGTQVVNAADTFLNVVHEANTLAAANPKAAAMIYGGLGRGISNSRPDAILALTQGRRISATDIGQAPAIMEQARFGEKGGVSILDTGMVSRMTKAVLESKVSVPLNAWKYIGRAMSASDSVMFRGAQEARSGLLAFRIATEEGLTSSQRTKRANEILGWDRFDEFLQQAKSEGYYGAEQGARATELMLMQRPQGLQQDASAFAASATYNEKPGGTLGFIASLARQLSDKHPGFRLIVPFTNIVANVFNRRLDNLPGVALYRARRGYYESEEAGKNALIRMNISFGMISALLGMVAADLIDITGPGPEDSEKRKQLRETGWRPYSIKAGDTYFSYANTPISLGLGIVGNMMDWSRYKKSTDKDDKAFAEAALYSVFGLGSYLFSQSFISGLANFFDMLGASKGKAEFAVRNFVSQTTSSFVPLTGLLKDIDSAFDDTRKESKRLGAAVLAQIPFARFMGRQALNAFGEPIKTGRIRPLSRFAGQERKDPAWQLIADKQLRVPVPDPFFKTDAENYEYQKESGRRSKQWVLDNADVLRSLSTEEAQELLSESTSTIRKGIRGDMLMKSIQNGSQKN